MTRRRAASFTKDNEWVDRPWPTVTPTLLADHEKLERTHTRAEINQAIFSLIKARKAISDARIFIHAASRANDDKLDVVKQLAAIKQLLNQAHEMFPLSVTSK